MSTHAKLSPSASKRWMTCPGSQAIIDIHPSMDRDSDNTESRRGTAAHALLEVCLNEGCDAKNYRDWIIDPDTGEVMQPTFDLKQKAVEPDYYIVDLEDMIEPVQETIDYVKDRLIEYGYEFETTADAVKAGVLQLERRVTILEDRDDCFGTADILIYAWPEIMEIIDYKNGAGILVEVHDNPQLLSYLLGSVGGLDIYENYRYTVAQPRHWGGGIESVDLDYTTLMEFKDRLSEKAVDIDNATALIYGESDGSVENSIAIAHREGLLEPNTECRWCSIQPICVAAKEKVEELTQMDFADDPHELAPPLEEPYHLADVLNWKSFINAYVKACEGRVEDIIAEGDQVPGYIMVPKLGTRQWRSDLSVRQIKGRLRSRYGIDPDDITEPAKLKSGPVVEKLVPKAQKKEFSDDFLYKPSTGFKLVKDDGNNEPMSTAKDDFK